jgi:hypothetical protein
MRGRGAGWETWPGWLDIRDYGARADGSDATYAIRACLEEASLVGGIILVPEGTWIISNTLYLGTNIVLYGLSAARTIIRFAGGIAPGTPMVANLDQAGGNNHIIIEGIKFDANRAVNGAVANLDCLSLYPVTDSRIIDCEITGATRHGIDLSFGKRNVVSRNKITDFGNGALGFGVALVCDCLQNRVTNNYIESSQTNILVGIDDESGALPSTPSDENIVEHNILVGGNYGVCIEGDCSRNIIQANELKGQANTAVLFAQGGELKPPKDNIVSDNEIVGTVDGITVLGWGNIIKGNRIATGNYGIRIPDIDNTIAPNRGLAILNNSISGQTYNGIRSVSATGLIIRGNIIRNTTASGIVVDSTARAGGQVDISNNFIKDVGLYGIDIAKVTNALAYINCCDNVIINCSKAAGNTYEAIRVLSSVDGVTLKNNLLFDDQGPTTSKDILLIDVLATNVDRFNNRSWGIAGLTPPISQLNAGLDISSTLTTLIPPRMTTVQKNALTAVDGMIVYDSTLKRLECRENGAWVDL